MLLLIFLLYLALAARVRIAVQASADGLSGNAFVVVRAVGVCVRVDRAFDGIQSVFSAKHTEMDAEKAKESGPKSPERAGSPGKLLRRLVRRAMQVELLEFSARIGLEEAWATALSVGGVRAAALSALSVLPPAKRQSLEIVPDFSSPCFQAHLRCIFSVTLGDIMLTAAGAAMKK